MVLLQFLQEYEQDGNQKKLYANFVKLAKDNP
jgi:hypothetical protein